MDDLDWKLVAALQEDGRRSYRDLASDLRVSPGTVRKHLKNSYGRLQVSSRVAAVGVAFPNSGDDLQYA